MDSTDDMTNSTAGALASVPEQGVQQWIAEGKLPAIAGHRGRVVGLVDVRQRVAPEGTSPGTLAATVASKISGAVVKAVTTRATALFTNGGC